MKIKKLKNGDREQADAILRQLIEQENALLDPENHGIHLAPIVRKHLDLPMDPGKMDDSDIRKYLTHIVHMLAEHHLCLTNTNHLDDRQLYQYILDEVLPQPIGIGPDPVGGLLYHECCPCDDFDRWLAYYADDFDREEFKSQWDQPLPDKLPLASDRDIWIEILAESFRDEPLPDYDSDS